LWVCVWGSVCFWVCVGGWVWGGGCVWVCVGVYRWVRVCVFCLGYP